MDSCAQDPLFGPLISQPGVRLVVGIGRLKPGVSLTQAQAEMDTLGARLAKEFPARDSGFTIRIEPYRQVVVGNVKSALPLLLGAVGLLLLIACANIANLLLSRVLRERERLQCEWRLGRARIVRQLPTESVLLGLLGGFAGVLLAASSVWSLRPFLPPEMIQISPIHVGGPVLAFALLLSLAAVLAFGLAPALLTTPSNLSLDHLIATRSHELECRSETSRPWRAHAAMYLWGFGTRRTPDTGFLRGSADNYRSHDVSRARVISTMMEEQV